jgi:hypothetical protein
VGKTTIGGALFCTPHETFLGDQIKKNEMGQACGM